MLCSTRVRRVFCCCLLFCFVVFLPSQVYTEVDPSVEAAREEEEKEARRRKKASSQGKGRGDAAEARDGEDPDQDIILGIFVFLKVC